MAETGETHRKVTNIVNNIKKTTNNPANGVPVIVNTLSKFVVVTYWWGRDKKNRNTARPCADFYEDYIKKVNKFMVNLIYTTAAKVKNDGKADQAEVINTIFTNLKADPTKFPSLMDMIHKMVKHYMRNVCDYYNVGQKNQDPCKMLFYKDKAQTKKTPPKQKTPDELFTNVYAILIDGLIQNKENLIRLNQLQTEYNALKAKVLNDRSNNIRHSDEILNQDLASVRLKQSEKATIQQELISTLKDKSSGPSIFDRLISFLEYKPPIQFEQMIDQWKKDCETHGCNHLAVEYSEFAEEGGYQLAINAKPKFIQKALELCPGRGVLYIDGDMNIRSYPGIFDIDNVDYMARGWWIDPRSNWKMTESIMYDPYNFETSGGTMFFSSSSAANKLLQLWIITAEKPLNAGKADDRVLSLVFNTLSVLTWLRVIQLPVEYLWLSLDYDERMLVEVYDYDMLKMKSTVLLDHPECLTSEDTATGAGASNDRQPKFYDFLEDVFPCVETTHEYIMFKSLVEKSAVPDDKLTAYMQLSDETKKDRADEIKQRVTKLNTRMADPATNAVQKAIFKQRRDGLKVQQNELLYLPYFYWYYHYMGGVQYINDGNADLYDEGFVDPEDEDGENNAQPLSIISYKDRFGNKPHPGGEGVSYNKIVDINMAYATDPENEESLKTEANVTVDKTNPNLIEIIPNDATFETNKAVIQLLLKYLVLNKTVLINPKHSQGYKSFLYEYITKKVNTLYKEIDFIFFPELLVTIRRSSFYKPKIFMNQVILFKPEQRLIDFISMQLSLEDLSVFIFQGSYEFMSLVRVAYLSNKHKNFTPSPQGQTPSPNFEISNPNSQTPAQITSGGGNTPSIYHSNKILEDYSNTFEKLFDHVKKHGAAPNRHSKKKRTHKKKGARKHGSRKHGSRKQRKKGKGLKTT